MKLLETRHPSPVAQKAFDRLVGLEEQKAALLDTLEILLARERFTAWQARHHPDGLGVGFLVGDATPLVLLSGDVGCGKTALATSIGSPLAGRLNAPVLTLETPSEIRGHGLVGEISSRVTEAFRQARSAVGPGTFGILFIDEGDDLATSREQLQAHHEDRAGVNALIKEVDRVASDSSRICVILATNRPEVLDPALLRRASLHLSFKRPSGPPLAALWESLLGGVAGDRDIARLARKCQEREPKYTCSDLVHRVAHVALLRAFRERRRLAVDDFETALASTEPSPPFQGAVIQT